AILPRYRQQEMQVLDEGEVARLLVAAQGSPYATLFRLAVMTGMRLGELMGLRWADLSWQHGTLHVQRQVQRVDGQGWQFLEPKTRASRRIVPLSGPMLMALRAHQEQQQLQRELKGARWTENGLIFTNSMGNPLDPSNMRKEFNRVLEFAGLPRVRFHDLRHTAASLMLNNHVPLIVAARMLGHQRPSVTLDIYGHLYHDKQSQAAEILEGLIGPTPVALPERAEVIIDVE
ncbi:MAG TPA: site-specific integrase, partial [Anaerolineaceae bacterium]|nr:site-specific integrase [Anaerolineaceae bacterium]